MTHESHTFGAVGAEHASGAYAARGLRPRRAPEGGGVESSARKTVVTRPLFWAVSANGRSYGVGGSICTNQGASGAVEGGYEPLFEA